MAISAREVESIIDAALTQPWSIRDGQVVPTSEDVVLAGGAVKLNATMLYADLADSTELAMYDRGVAARVFKAFLAGASKIIRDHGGYIRSFDGDRVLGVFIGGSKNTSAVKCSLQINWMFMNILRPKFSAKYEVFRTGQYKLAHGVGVDTSEVLVVRAGIHAHNDLIWVGSAPNVAAKLSAIRDSPYHTFISGSVYDQTADEAKISSAGVNMWEERTWSTGPIKRVFRSHYWWALP